MDRLRGIMKSLKARLVIQHERDDVAKLPGVPMRQ